MQDNNLEGKDLSLSLLVGVEEPIPAHCPVVSLILLQAVCTDFLRDGDVHLPLLHL